MSHTVMRSFALAFPVCSHSTWLSFCKVFIFYCCLSARYPNLLCWTLAMTTSTFREYTSKTQRENIIREAACFNTHCVLFQFVCRCVSVGEHICSFLDQAVLTPGKYLGLTVLTVLSTSQSFRGDCGITDFSLLTEKEPKDKVQNGK